MITIDHKHDVEQYIAGVMDGTVVTGRLMKLAVRRHLKDLEDAGERGFVFEESYAIEAIKFFRACRHSKGEFAGQPFQLSPWQKFVVWVLFGWRRASDGLRRFRKAYITVGRKNGKSTFCAALALLLMVFDNPYEHGAEIYTAATMRDQARIIWDETRRMRSQSPDLKRAIGANQSRLYIEGTASKLEALAGDGDNLDGLNPHGMFLDELHAWTERQREKYEKLTTGSGSRTQPLTVEITTAGSDKSTLWKEEDDFAVKTVESVITGEIISDTMAAFIFRIDDDDDPFDESCWIKANPCLGESCTWDYLREKAEEARHKPTALNTFRRFHCNVEVVGFARALDAELWTAGVHSMDISGEPSYGGFDLGRTDDFAAIATVTPRTLDKRTIYEVRSKSYTCVLRPSSEYDMLISQWIKDGHLEEHTDNQIDFSLVEDDIVSWTGIHNVSGWWFDATFATQMSQNLINTHGITAEKFTQTNQAYNEPVRSFLRELAAGNIWHEGDPCQTWQAMNLVLDINTRGESRPDKSHRKKKIDAMVAILMAFAQAIFTVAEAPKKPQLFFG